MSDKKKPYRILGRPQTIYRVVKSANNPYVMIDRRPIENPILSFKAKGILSYLLSRPDGWEVSVSDLINKATDGEDSVRSGLGELERAGHLKRTRTRAAGAGTYTGLLIEVYEVPHAGFPDVVCPDVVCPDVENPTQVLSTLSKNKRNKEEDRKIVTLSTKQKKSFANETTQDMSEYWYEVGGKRAPRVLRAALRRFYLFAEGLGLPRGQYLTDTQTIIEKTFRDEVTSHTDYMLTCIRTLHDTYEINYPRDRAGMA